MKKVIAALTMTMLMVGCGDETNVYGYSDEDVQNMFAVFKDSIVHDITDSLVVSSKDTIYKVSKDTIYKIEKDTVYKTSKDTVYKISKDTLRLTRTDTVYSVMKKDSIVYVNTTDTVFNVIKDSALIRIVDSVYHQRESIVNEIPRDTSITLYDTSKQESGITISTKTWNGKVYKGVFYDTSAYVAKYQGFPSYAMLRNDRNNSSVSYFYCLHQCGAMTKPEGTGLYSSCWNDREKMGKRYDGWRVFSFADVLSLGKKIESIVGTNTIYFYSEPDFIEFGAGERTIYHNISSTGEITYSIYSVKESIYSDVKYLCAYDLSE